MFGGGTWEGGSCEEKNADFAGKPGSPLNGAWRWKGGRMIRSRHHPVCVAPSRWEMLSKCAPPLHKGRQEVWGGDSGDWAVVAQYGPFHSLKKKDPELG